MKERLDRGNRLGIHCKVCKKMVNGCGVVFRVKVRRELVCVLVHEGDVAVRHELA